MQLRAHPLRWEDVDQKVAAVGEIRAQQYNNTEFYTHGFCSSYSHTVHYYDWEHGTPGGPVDMFNKRCVLAMKQSSHSLKQCLAQHHVGT